MNLNELLADIAALEADESDDFPWHDAARWSPGTGWIVEPEPDEPPPEVWEDAPMPDLTTTRWVMVRSGRVRYVTWL